AGPVAAPGGSARRAASVQRHARKNVLRVPVVARQAERGQTVMRWATWMLLNLLALALLLVSSDTARAQRAKPRPDAVVPQVEDLRTAAAQASSVAREVHELIANLEYRRAERLALHTLARFQERNLPPWVYRQVTTELGVVYLS